MNSHPMSISSGQGSRCHLHSTSNEAPSGLTRRGVEACSIVWAWQCWSRRGSGRGVICEGDCWYGILFARLGYGVLRCRETRFEVSRFGFFGFKIQNWGPLFSKLQTTCSLFAHSFLQLRAAQSAADGTGGLGTHGLTREGRMGRRGTDGGAGRSFSLRCSSKAFRRAYFTTESSIS